MNFGDFTSKGERLTQGDMCVPFITKKGDYVHPLACLHHEGLCLVSSTVPLSTENQNYERMNKVKKKTTISKWPYFLEFCLTVITASSGSVYRMQTHPANNTNVGNMEDSGASIKTHTHESWRKMLCSRAYFYGNTQPKKITILLLNNKVHEMDS